MGSESTPECASVASDARGPRNERARAARSSARSSHMLRPVHRRSALVVFAALAGVPRLVEAASPIRAYEGPTATPMVGEPVEASPPIAKIDAAPSRAPASPAVGPAPRPAVDPPSPVRVRPGLDAMIIVGAAAPGIALGLWVEPALQNNVPTPGADPHVKKIDRVALDRFATGPNIASDVLLGTSVLAPFVYHAIEAGVRRRGWSPVRGRGFVPRYGTDVVILLETLAVNALLTQLLKTAIRRPRPFTFIDPDTVDPSIRDELVAAQAKNSADWSFPSGHASFAFAATTAGATLLTLEMLGRRRWPIALAWIGGLSLASTTAVLRVAAGRHFPSDVITSALFGSGVGAAVPLAHWRPTRSGDHGRDDRRPRRWALSPMMGRATSGAVLITRW